ncbi:MAG: 50S ribosomal protein L6 [Pseudomonadales bacterium]|nr:50S ribosomal protein L6 [Pseudomonadales bacterium]
MSRVGKSPIELPEGVEAEVTEVGVRVKGRKGELTVPLRDDVEVEHNGNELLFKANSREGWAMAGTTRALVDNVVQGVNNGWEKKLELMGVGYRAQARGSKLTMQLGFSHPVDYEIPAGLEISTPSQTEIVVSGVDKQLVGQASAEIRAYRPPEPYKGKGVRYAGERVRRKEAKKK